MPVPFFEKKSFSFHQVSVWVMIIVMIMFWLMLQIPYLSLLQKKIAVQMVQKSVICVLKTVLQMMRLWTQEI